MQQKMLFNNNILKQITRKTEDLIKHKLNTRKDAQDRIRDFDLENQLPYEFLNITDRFSMAHSIEARTPFG